MIHLFVSREEGDEAEEIHDEDATLADDLLDEVSADDSDEDDAVEGFGILPETEEEDEDEEKEDELAETDDELEDDAEDVDFDTFDDVDEM